MYYSTAKEMERLDELAVASGLEIRQMMELAGWHMVTLFAAENIPTTARITIVVGKGNKGGDGLSAARHLVNAGWQQVTVVMVSRETTADSLRHRQLIEQMGIPILYTEDDEEAATAVIHAADVCVDSLIGYQLDGAVRGLFVLLVEAMNTSAATVIAYDLPTGLDPDTGEATGVSVRADITLTLALHKKLFTTPAGQSASGQVYMADIGIQAFLYEKIAPSSRPEFVSGLLQLLVNESV